MDLFFVCVCLAFIIIAGQVSGENIQDYICQQRFKGFKIDYAQRRCVESEALGCTNPFPYETMNECNRDFHGRGNVCDSLKPCLHGSVCLPVTTEEKGRTYKCDCSATGYYGKHCQNKCPHDLSSKHPRQTACVQIG